MSIVNTTDKYVRREVIEIVFYWALAIIMMGLLPLGIGLIGKAFEGQFTEPLTISTYLGQYVVYYIFIIIALFLPIFTIAKLILLKKGQHISELEKPKWYHILTADFIFSPEENGALWYFSEKLGFKDNRNLMRWSKSILRVFVIGILIFGGILLLRVAFPQQMAFFSLSAIPQLVYMQITPLSEVVFTAEPASFGETATLLFLFAIIEGIIGYICAKFKLKKMGFFLISLFFTPFLLSLAWGGIHSVVYGNSDVDFVKTMVFGFVGALMTILFGQFTWWYVLHFLNNTITKLQEIILVKEDLLFIGFIIWFLILILYIALEIYLYSRKKKIGEDTYFNE